MRLGHKHMELMLLDRVNEVLEKTNKMPSEKSQNPRREY